ncbi:uncharacterized protein BJ212DRAFT_1485950 [Suillus subaureus]|uniref:Uncharacterized protein n=1 Tax=Suillus subaureus TaxID=48587 RepID=A0A9P7DYE0_9AGAM|nr:uncharacterized protein BJ212DRAFT_1485950 [Suillus subaureus]KAG1806197.1 hypothetical protein BJ212DRAFT_1485950 [Suillus subaureus]
MVFHTAGDDLESLFYIFIEFVTTFNGLHAMTKDKTRKPMWYDYWLLMGDNSWVPNPVIQKWCFLILAATEAASKKNGPPSSVSYEELAMLFHKWLSQLPPEMPKDVSSATASPLSIVLVVLHTSK